MRIAAHPLLLMSLGCTGCSSLSLHQERPQPMVVTAFEDAKFIPDLPGRSESPEVAVLWGDPSTGPSAMLIRVEKGPLPMHNHSSDYHLVVLQGLVKHWSADQTEEDAKPLGPGSHWFQPGNEAHADNCLSSECLVHIVWAGKRDGKLVQPRTNRVQCDDTEAQPGTGNQVTPITRLARQRSRDSCASACTSTAPALEVR